VPASPPTVCRGIGICAYVALSVLGAILRETGLLDCRMGSLALAIAGVHAGLRWILLGPLLWGPAGQTSEGPGVFAGEVSRVFRSAPERPARSSRCKSDTMKE
jgi:hypothetical protein